MYERTYKLSDVNVCRTAVPFVSTIYENIAHLCVTHSNVTNMKTNIIFYHKFTHVVQIIVNIGKHTDITLPDINRFNN